MIMKKGYTLLEVIIVVAIVTLIIPAITNVLFSILQQQKAIVNLTEMRRTGDSTLTFFKNKINEKSYIISSTSSSVDQQCSTSGSSYDGDIGESFYFIAVDNDWFRIYQSGNQLLYETASGAQAINSNRTEISEFSIKCDRKASFSSPLVYISFKVDVTNPGPFAGPLWNPSQQEAFTDLPALHYQTKVKLSSY